MDKLDINQMSPLIWAYIGDAVYEEYIRYYLIMNNKYKPHKLHIESTKYVKASAQAEILKQIESILTEDELDIVRRGRNVKNHHLPKNASVQDYMNATAFEGLIGYLYLIKQEDRLKEILSKIKIDN